MTQTGWILSLSQFYLGLGFVLFFLALELGLAWILFALRLKAGQNEPALFAYRFWVRVFALATVLSFAASLPLVLQFGTLWPGFMAKAGALLGPILGLLILTAFVFKSCFLGAMLYGQRKLGNIAHTLVVLMVAIGTSIYSWWLILLLAWMLNPTGTSLANGQIAVVDWLAVFNGSAVSLSLLYFSAALLFSFSLILSFTAYRSRLRPGDAAGRLAYAISVWLVLPLAILQIVLALRLGYQLLPAQPARLATVLMQWHTGPAEGLKILAWPATGLEHTSWQWLSDIDWAKLLLPANYGQVIGLEQLSGIHPPLWLSFYSARLAVLFALVILLLAVWLLGRALALRYQTDKFRRHDRFGLRVLIWLVVLQQLFGWTHLLSGNLPYAVYATFSLQELGTPLSKTWQILFLSLQLLVCLGFVYGFRGILRANARYGVIPVARHRGGV